MYSQFVTAEGKHLSILIAGTLAGSAAAHNIHKDARSLKRLKNCNQIKTRYRDLALRHHPDKNGNEEDFVTLTEAKEEALGSCTNNSNSGDGPPRMRRHASGRSKNKNAKHKTTSNKKKAKHRRKRERRQKKKEEGMSDMQKSLLTGAVVLGAGELIRRHDSRSHRPPRLRRQRSEEDYARATGHPRRR